MDSASNIFDTIIALLKWGAIFAIAFILRQPIEDLLKRLIAVSFGSASAKFNPVGEIDAPSVTGPQELLPEQHIEFLPEAKKILGTLWFHQKRRFGEDRTKIWTFEVSPNAFEYPIYIEGLSQLVKLGLAFVVPETHHCALSPKGYKFCDQNQDILPKDREIYRWD